MKKAKLTRNLMAAVSIVALSAVMYGCTHSGDDGPTAAELAAEQERADAAEQAEMDLDAAVKAVEAARMAVAGVSADMSTPEEVAAARTKVTEAQTAVMKLPEGNDLHASIAGIASDLAGIEMAQANAANEQTRAMQFETVNAALGMAQTAVDGLHQAGSTDAEIASARTLVTAAQDALDDATALTDEQRMSLDGMITALGTRLMDIDEYRATDAGQLAVANAAVDAAEVLVGALTDDSTPEEVGAAHAALQRAKHAVAAAVNLPDNVRTDLEEKIAELEGQAESQHGITMALAEATTAVTGLNADSSTAEEVAAARAKVDAAKQAVMELEDDDPRKTAVANLDAQLMGIETVVAARPTPEEIEAEEARVTAATKAAGTKETAIAAEAAQGPSQTPANPDAGLGGSDHVNADNTPENADDPYNLEISRDKDGTEIKITDYGMVGDDDPKFRQEMDLGGGTTMHVRTMEADDDGNVVEEVVVVSTDIAAPKATKFSTVYSLDVDLDLNEDADNDGNDSNDLTALGVDESDDGVLKLVMSDKFVRSTGSQSEITFPRYQEDSDGGTAGKQTIEAFETPGTYDDAMGTYKCNASATDCTVTLDDDGAITAMSEGWVFIPASGATVDVPDSDYLHYGFWLKKTMASDGATTYNEVETFAGSNTVPTASGLDVVNGSATYNGGATGVYVHSVSKMDGTRASATSGHFTADATLTAYFDQSVDNPATSVNEADAIAPRLLHTVTGTIDNFVLSGGEENSWSVALDADREASPNTVASASFDGTAQGSVASDPGSFSATFHGVAGDSIDHDGDAATATLNDVMPTSVVGEFNAGFTNGSVAGAFGATKDDD